MSKAFTRESDDLPEPPPPARVNAIPGGKNYLTPTGERKLREELERLTQMLGAPATEETSRERQKLRTRLLQLQDSLATAVIVPPPTPPWEQVLFGATVTARDAQGNVASYRIVGIDEADLDQNWVAWSSPIARALLKSRLGQRVHFRTPAGEQHWEITGVIYE